MRFRRRAKAKDGDDERPGGVVWETVVRATEDVQELAAERRPDWRKVAEVAEVVHAGALLLDARPELEDAP